VICNEEDTDGRARVTTDEERNRNESSRHAERVSHSIGLSSEQRDRLG